MLQDIYRDFLLDLLRLKTTVEPANQGEHDRCRELIAGEARGRDLSCTIIDSPPYPSQLVGEDPDNLSPTLLLAAHLDVVPAEEEMFEPRFQGGRLYARGVSDMKFIAPLYFRLMDELEPRLREKILIAFTYDEEIGGNAGTRYLLETHELRPSVCFLPDGGDNFQVEADEKGVIQFRMQTSGKSSHGSRPWLGENAIDKFLSIYSDLRKEFPEARSPEPWGPTLNLGKLTGGTAANQVPDSCEAMVDIRFTENHTLESIRALVEKIVAGRGVFTPTVLGDAFHLDPSSRCFRLIQEASIRHRGTEMPIYRSEGASDARFFPKYGIPVLITKPICGGHHSRSEWVDWESLEPYYRMLYDFAVQICSD
jgi:succinyl-diaminopimelate desuccinylase